MLPDLRWSAARVLTDRVDDWGTGFFVAPRGLVLTCSHVARKAVSSSGFVMLEVLGPPERGLEAPAHQQLRATFSETDEMRRTDVALLEVVDELPSWLTPLPLSMLDRIEKLAEIESYGFPKFRGTFGDPAHGTVTGMTFDDRRQPVIEIRSGELTSGYSGAPIVDSRTGQVIAMMKSTLRPDDRASFAEHAWAVPCSVIRAIAPRIHAEHHPVIVELLRVAHKRMPTILDYALDTTEFTPLIVPTLLVERERETTTVSERDLRAWIASREVSVVIIVGEAGSGKSSLLRGWLTTTDHERDLRRGVVEVPVYVRATSLAAVTGGEPTDRLRRALLEDRIVNVPSSFSTAEFESLLGSRIYQFVVLVDGLDEIGDPMLRSQTAAALRELAEALTKEGHCLVVASRPIPEVEILERTTLARRRARMAPVETPQREEFFKLFLGTEANALITKFRQYEGTRVGNLPMLLALTAVLFRESGSIPDSAAALLDDYLQLAAKRATRRSADRGEPATELPDSLRFLPAVAAGSLDITDLNRAVVRKIVQARLSASAPQGWPTAALRLAVEATLDAFGSEQIAAYWDGDRFRWIHQSLRDFLAGQHFADLATNGDDIRKRWPAWRDSGAREVVLFALVILSRRQDITPLLGDAIGFSGDDAPDEDTIRFLIEAVRMGLRLRQETLHEIIEATLHLGLDLSAEFNTCKRLLTFEPHPFDLLLKVRDSLPQAHEVLLDLIENDTLEQKTRAALARKLGESSE